MHANVIRLLLMLAQNVLEHLLSRACIHTTRSHPCIFNFHHVHAYVISCPALVQRHQRMHIYTAADQNVSILETSGPRPVVYAELIQKQTQQQQTQQQQQGEQPRLTVLIYGHYDVQVGRLQGSWCSWGGCTLIFD